MAVVCGAMGVGLFTVWVFPALAYVSIALFGAPASGFVLVGYGVWRLLKVRWPALADPFLVAFTVPVAFVLLAMVFSLPFLVTSILAPTTLVEIVRRGPWTRRSRVTPYDAPMRDPREPPQRPLRRVPRNRNRRMRVQEPWLHCESAMPRGAGCGVWSSFSSQCPRWPHQCW